MQEATSYTAAGRQKEVKLSFVTVSFAQWTGKNGIISLLVDTPAVWARSEFQVTRTRADIADAVGFYHSSQLRFRSSLVI